MPDMISGNRGTASINSAAIPVLMSDIISDLQPKKTPLLVLFSRMQGKAVAIDNSKHEWLEDERIPEWDAINAGAGYAAGILDLVVDNAGYFRAGDLVWVPRTGEVINVVSISSPTLTVTRSWGAAAAAALVDNEPLLIIANTAVQGASAGTGRSTVKVEKYNRTSIISSLPFGVTGTLDSTKVVGRKDEMSYQQGKHLVDQFVAMERAIWFSQRGYDTTTASEPRASMGGVMESIETNVYDCGGALTEANFEKNFCEPLFQHNAGEQIVFFAGARVLTVMNGWGRDKLKTESGDQKYGLRFMTYISAHGDLKLVKHPLFIGTTLSGTGVALNMAELEFNYMKKRRLNLMTEAPSLADTKRQMYLSEISMKMRLEKKHAKLEGVTG